MSSYGLRKIFLGPSLWPLGLWVRSPALGTNFHFQIYWGCSPHPAALPDGRGGVPSLDFSQVGVESQQLWIEIIRPAQRKMMELHFETEEAALINPVPHSGLSFLCLVISRPNSSVVPFWETQRIWWPCLLSPLLFFSPSSLSFFLDFFKFESQSYWKDGKRELAGLLGHRNQKEPALYSEFT